MYKTNKEKAMDDVEKCKKDERRGSKTKTKTKTKSQRTQEIKWVPGIMQHKTSHQPYFPRRKEHSIYIYYKREYDCGLKPKNVIICVWLMPGANRRGFPVNKPFLLEEPAGCLFVQKQKQSNSYLRYLKLI